MKTMHNKYSYASGLFLGSFIALGLLPGCATSAALDEGETVGSAEQELTIPGTVPTTPNTYVVLTSGTASFGDRTRVTAGHIGSGAPTGVDAVTLGSDGRAVLDGATIGRRIVLKDRSQAGGLFATQVSAPFARYASLAAFSAPPAPPAISAVTAGTTAITVNSGQTLTRAAGAYGNVTVNGTLRLSGGTYSIQSLTLGPDGIVQADADTELRVATKVTGADRSKILAPASAGAAGLRVVVAGATDANGGVTLGNDSKLTALVLSKAAVRTGSRLTGSGAIGASSVNIGTDSTLAFSGGFECSTDAQCADSNACSVDRCQNGRCAHPAAPNGTACDDGNACTTTDTCTAGACTGDGTLSCDDGLYCNGTESCDPASGCVAGAAPSMSDGVDCTSDSCDEAFNTSSHTPNDASCGAGFYCDILGGCLSLTPPGGLGGASP